MILSADKESKTILAINETGSISNNWSNISFNQWIKETSDEIEKSLNSIHNEAKSNYEQWDYITNKNDTIVEIEFIASSKLQSSRSHENSYKLAWVDPTTGLYCNWGQQSPYNFHAPNGALAGCPAVAVGMLCYNYSYPKGDWTYWKMPYKLTAIEDNDIARLFKYVADQIPNYTWSTTASGASPNDILSGIKKLGYENASILPYDFKTVYNNIYNEYPVLIGGYASSGGGHIWYCDGYCNR